MSSKFLWVPPSSGTRHTGTRQEGNLTTQGTRGELAQKCRGLRRPRSNVRFVWHARPILFPTASSLLRQMHVMKLHTWPAMLVRQQATARLGTSTSRKPRGKLGNAEHWMLSVWLSDIDLHIIKNSSDEYIIKKFGDTFMSSCFFILTYIPFRPHSVRIRS